MLKIAEAPSVLLNHHFGRLHDGCRRVALLKLQLIGAATGNDALDEVVANANDDVRHYVSQDDLFDLTAQFVSR